MFSNFISALLFILFMIRKLPQRRVAEILLSNKVDIYMYAKTLRTFTENHFVKINVLDL